MGSSFAQNPAFDEPNGYEISHQELAPAAGGRMEQALRAVAPKLIAMSGLALFGCALLVAFRIIALDAVHELQQPAIDFAICGAVAFLGLSISWVQLGDSAEVEVEDIADNTNEFTIEHEYPATAVRFHAPAASYPPVTVAPAATVLRDHPRQQRRMGGHACPYCGQKMMFVGPALLQCCTCRHLENHGPVSFLDSADPCNCANCRHNLQHAG